MTSQDRVRPNILITGTPGTGKTSLAAQVASILTDYEHVEVSDLIKAKHLHEGWDEEHEAYICDEDKVCDELEEVLAKGACVVDFHSCDFFPERWFDLIVVLRADNGVLFDRLAARGYSAQKIEENVEAEIMQVVADEARGAYDEDFLVEWTSNNLEELQANVSRIAEWVSTWHGSGTVAP